MATIVGTLRRLLVNGFRRDFHPGQREFRMGLLQVPAHQAKLAERMAARISRKPVGSKVEGELHKFSCHIRSNFLLELSPAILVANPHSHLPVVSNRPEISHLCSQGIPSQLIS
jgi:hypothetical protein